MSLPSAAASQSSINRRTSCSSQQKVSIRFSPPTGVSAPRGIQVWHGHNYALDPIRELGLLERGGALRIGLAHYNTRAEVDEALNALEAVVATAP